MQKRKLGSSELYITPIGLGAWALGGGGWAGGWGPQSDDDSIATIHRALDLGINWIDTAPYYGLGHSEQLVGRALEGKRQSVIVATKCGLVWDSGTTQVRRCLKADSVRREVEASLHRLNTDVIDLYQIHWPTESDEETAEAWGVIAEFIKSGKVRYGGVSNCSVVRHQRLHAMYPISSSQPSYNMIMRNDEEDVLPYCAANNIGVIVARSLMGGILSGAFTKETAANLPNDDWRKNRPPFQEPELTANLALVDGLRPIAERYGRTVAQLSIAWVLRRPEVSGVIAGPLHPFEIEDDVAAGDWTLLPEDLAAIDALLARRQEMLVQVQRT